ncbi:MAG: hypothetical protein E6J90_37150 [Deltaproteobacteria bacterium]|nr:MAG: hypothetical protein E6J91_33350 [Deltaproteobacteria bacterium]TMQ09851.1 MAG: hypothetical protein E6J90_37150 [Deltaproteobacteria bacterium]
MDWRLQPGPLVIASAIATAQTAKGIAESIKIVDDLAATEVPAAELENSKQNMIRALPADFSTNAAEPRCGAVRCGRVRQKRSRAATFLHTAVAGRETQGGHPEPVKGRFT